MDAIDQRLASLPEPLSVTDREHLSAARRLLALEAARALGRAQTAGAPADELRWSSQAAKAAGTIDALLKRRGA